MNSRKAARHIFLGFLLLTIVTCIESPAQRQYKRARQKAIAYIQSTSQSAVGSGRGG